MVVPMVALCSLYYPPNDGQAAPAAQIKERCVDNAIGWMASGQRCKLKSNVDVLSAPPAIAASARGTSVKSCEILRDRSGKWLRESIAGFKLQAIP